MKPHSTKTATMTVPPIIENAAMSNMACVENENSLQLMLDNQIIFPCQWLHIGPRIPMWQTCPSQKMPQWVFQSTHTTEKGRRKSCMKHLKAFADCFHQQDKTDWDVMTNKECNILEDHQAKNVLEQLYCSVCQLENSNIKMWWKHWKGMISASSEKHIAMYTWQLQIIRQHEVVEKNLLVISCMLMEDWLFIQYCKQTLF